MNQHTSRPVPIRHIMPYFHRRRFGPHASGGYLQSDILKAYGFPKLKRVTAKRPRIAIAVLGGGYYPGDLKASADAQGIPVSNVTDLSALGATNSPGDDADVELALDLQNSGGCYAATMGEPADLYPVFAPNSDAGYKGIVDLCVQMMIEVLSQSWGGPSSQWLAASMKAQSASYALYASQGGLVLTASGDGNSKDGTTKNTTDYPAEDPNNISCGGTSIQILGSGINETTWNDGRGDGTGGGISTVYARLPYQPTTVQGIALTGRGIPDVSGPADPNTGWKTWVNAAAEIIGGTSAVAPMWAGILASVIAAGANPVGLLQRLYIATGIFNDVITGNNGGYQAGPGYDLCTGLGTPIGDKLVAYLLGDSPVPPPVNPPPVNPPPVNPPSGSVTIPARILTGTVQVHGPLGTHQGTCTVTDPGGTFPVK